MFCEFLGVEREEQTYQLLIGEYNQSQRNPFVPHDSTGIICSSDCVYHPSWIDHQQPGASLVRSSLVDTMECRGGVSLQCQCTLRLRPWNKTQSNLHKLKGTLCSRIQSYQRVGRAQRTTSWTGRIHSLTTTHFVLFNLLTRTLLWLCWLHMAITELILTASSFEIQRMLRYAGSWSKSRSSEWFSSCSSVSCTKPQ